MSAGVLCMKSFTLNHGENKEMIHVQNKDAFTLFFWSFSRVFFTLTI